MAIPVYASLGMNQNQINSVALDNQAANPSTPVVGQIYYNTVSNTPFVWNGTAWTSLFSSGGARFAQTIGNGVLLTFVVNHNLGTQDTVESVYSASAPFAEQLAVIQHTDANNTTFIFTVPPLLNSVRVDNNS
jgi:hypothetical protein